jgi:hypothetical protein
MADVREDRVKDDLREARMREARANRLGAVPQHDLSPARHPYPTTQGQPGFPGAPKEVAEEEPVSGEDTPRGAYVGILPGMQEPTEGPAYDAYQAALDVSHPDDVQPVTGETGEPSSPEHRAGQTPRGKTLLGQQREPERR